MRCTVTGAVLLALSVTTSRAQTAADLVASGVRAYNNLEFQTAATFFLRALSQPGDGLAPAASGRARSYLGASQVFLSRPDSAEAVFGDLLIEQPRYRLDELVFPPQVSAVFERVRRRTFAVSLAAAADTSIASGAGGYSVWVYASSFHRVTAEVVDADSALVRALYSGPIADSLEIQWDGLVRDGLPVAGGSYMLRVRSEELSGRVVRRVDLPLDVRVVLPDVLPVPPPPADSLFLPERAASGPGLRALVGGVVAGAAVALVPSLVATERDLGAARYAAGAGIGLAGVIGFLLQRPGRVLQRNAAANEAIRDEWRRQAERIRAENDRRAADVRITFRAGSPRRVTLSGP